MIEEIEKPKPGKIFCWVECQRYLESKYSDYRGKSIREILQNATYDLNQDMCLNLHRDGVYDNEVGTDEYTLLVRIFEEFCTDDEDKITFHYWW